MRVFRFIGVLLGLSLAACGSVHDRSGCSASTECPVGQYCARTGDGNVCWADAVPPAVSNVTVACLHPTAGGSCLRDGVLRVQATVTDDQEVLGAEVAFDVGGAPVQLARAGGNVWNADVALSRLPFDHFEHAVVATVTVRDGARNTAALEPLAPTTVTRQRFARALDTGVFGLGHPAVMQDGSVATAGTNAKVYVLPWDGAGLGTSVSVGTLQITAAPLAVGASLWIGSEDFKVYEVKNLGAGWTPTERADTGGPVRGSLGVTSGGFVVATSDFGVVYAIPAVGVARNSGIASPYSLGPVIDENDSVYSVSGGTVRKMTITLGIPGDVWSPSPTLGMNVASALAWSGGLFALPSNGSNAFVTRLLPGGGDPQFLATTAVAADGIAILSDGSLLVPEQTKTVSRWTSTGASFPGWQKPDLGGATRTPLVLTAAAPFIVPTAKGAVYALRPDGTVAWSGQLSAGTAALQPGNIYTPPGQPAGNELSTAYFAGSDGVLHAVIVDGKLDADAPWPKAFHDPRNTNRAGAQP